jgi:hypothetical protein
MKVVSYATYIAMTEKAAAQLVRHRHGQPGAAVRGVPTPLT